MKKGKVVVFFVLLLFFVVTLTIIEIVNQGKSAGFIFLNSNGNGGATGNQDILVFGIYALLFVLVSAFIFNYFKKYTDRVIYEKESDEVPFNRKMIKFDLSGSSEPEKDNF